MNLNRLTNDQKINLKIVGVVSIAVGTACLITNIVTQRSVLKSIVKGGMQVTLKVVKSELDL